MGGRINNDKQPEEEKGRERGSEGIDIRAEANSQQVEHILFQFNPFITNLTRTIMPGSILSTCQQPSSASIYLPAPLQPLIHRKAAEHAGRQTPCCTRDAERDDVPVQRDVSY